MTKRLPTRPIADLPGEEWRDIPGTNGKYRASSEGRVRSVRTPTNRCQDKLLSLKRGVSQGGAHGYLHVSLCDDAGKAHPVSVHVLIARTFLGARPSGMQVCHNDGVKTNNRAANLRYDTPANNRADAYRHGAYPRGTGHKKSKLTDEAIRWMLLNEGCTTKQEMALRFGIDIRTVIDALNRRTWRHVA